MESPAVPARLIGAIFVDRGLVTQEDLDSALAEQAQRGGLLGEILVAKYGVSRLDLASAIAEQWAELERPAVLEDDSPAAPVLTIVEALEAAETAGRRPLGEIFIEQGMITEQELADALTTQRETGERLGEILVARGAISRLELASALADQWSTLQKLRPPAPAATDGESSSDRAPSSGETDQRLGELAARVAALELRAAPDPDEAPTERLEGLDAAVQAAETRFRAALEEIESARAEGARRLAELAGEMPPLAAEVQGLVARTERLETRADEEIASALDDLRARLAAVDDVDDGEVRRRIDEIGARVDEVAARVDDVASRPVPDDSVVEGFGTRLAELDAALHEVRARPTIEPHAVEELRARLDTLEGRSDEDVRAALAELSGRFEDLARRPTADPSWTDELWSRLEAVERRNDDDLRRRVDELASRQHELAQQADGGPQRLEEVHRRVTQLEDDREPWREWLDALEERIASLAARPTVEPELVDELRIRIQGVEGRTDHDVRRLVDELSQRLDELADRAGVDAALVDQLGSRLAAAEELGSRVDGLDELRSRLAAVEARSDEEVWTRLDELHGDLSTLRSRPAIDPSVLVDLERRIESFGGHESPDAQGTSEAVASLQDRIETLEGRGDDGLRDWLETLARRIDGLEQQSADGASLPARLNELEERQRAEAAGLADRVSEALGALTAWIDALRSAEGEARSVLADATQRVDELERRSGRLDDVERSVAALRDRPAQNEATVALWRAVDTLRGRSEQALALLGELGSRVEGLEAAPRDHSRFPVEAERLPQSVRPLPADGHVLFVPGGDRYELVERDGAPPALGEWIALDETAALLVSRVGRSPLPGDERPCAFLTPS